MESFFLALAFAFSSDRKHIRWKYVALLLVIQFIFALILLKTTAGIHVIGGISNGFNYLLQKLQKALTLSFGGFKFVNPKTLHSSFSVLLPIVFISALIGILQYTRILPLIINWLGWLISKINGMGRLESYNAVAAAILGQSEVFISLKTITLHTETTVIYINRFSYVYRFSFNYWRILYFN